jgi:hypothetical protein
VRATAVMIVLLSPEFYYVREMLASLVLFSVIFFSLSVVVLSAFFVWYAGSQVASWASPASRAVVTLFQRLASQARP